MYRDVASYWVCSMNKPTMIGQGEMAIARIAFLRGCVAGSRGVCVCKRDGKGVPGDG
jgi:hypothetical protein